MVSTDAAFCSVVMAVVLWREGMWGKDLDQVLCLFPSNISLPSPDLHWGEALPCLALDLSASSEIPRKEPAWV